MLVLGLFVVAVIGWLFWKGYLGENAGRKLMLGGAGALALFMLSRGQIIPAIVIGAATLGFGFFGILRMKKVAAMPMDELEARRILGVGMRATEAEILAAHRRIIGQVHPDRFPAGGGDPELARRVNGARDVLLRKPGASDA